MRWLVCRSCSVFCFPPANSSFSKQLLENQQTPNNEKQGYETLNCDKWRRGMKVVSCVNDPQNWKATQRCASLCFAVRATNVRAAHLAGLHPSWRQEASAEPPSPRGKTTVNQPSLLPTYVRNIQAPKQLKGRGSH